MKWLYLGIFCVFTLSGYDELSKITTVRPLHPFFLDKKRGLPREIRNIVVENLIPDSKHALIFLAVTEYSKKYGVIDEEVGNQKIKEIVPFIPENLAELDFNYSLLEGCFTKDKKFNAYLLLQLFGYLKRSYLTNCMYIFEKNGIRPFITTVGRIQGTSWILEKQALHMRGAYDQSIQLNVPQRKKEIVGAYFPSVGNYHFIAVDSLTNVYSLHSISRSVQLPPLASQPILCSFCNTLPYIFFVGANKQIISFNVINKQINQVINKKDSGAISIPLVTGITSLFHAPKIIFIDTDECVILFDLLTSQSIFEQKRLSMTGPHSKNMIEVSPYAPEFFSISPKPFGEPTVYLLNSITNPTTFSPIKLPISRTSIRSSVFLPRKQICFFTTLSEIEIFDLGQKEKIRYIKVGLPSFSEGENTLLYDYTAQSLSLVNKENASYRIAHYKKVVPKDLKVLLFFLKQFYNNHQKCFMPAWATPTQQNEIELLAATYGITIFGKNN